MRALLKREVAVLVLAAAVVALLFARAGGAPPPLRGARSAARLEPELAFVPDPARVLPRSAARGHDFERDPFAPPSDTRPLPPLAYEEPPRAPLDLVLAPTRPAPDPVLWGRLLSAPDEPREDLGLFAELARGEAEEPADAAPVTRAPDVRRALGELGRPAPAERLSAAERAARADSYKRLFDWIQLASGQTLYGAIENEDRYGLFGPRRALEPVQFRQLDPETGSEAFRGQPAIAYERERLADFGLARTRANELELALHGLGGGAPEPGNYHALLSLAERCLAVRAEAPRALEIAADLARALADFDGDDPAPRLVLARAREAAFDFEGAFATYRDLLERFPRSVEARVGLAALERRCLLFESAERRLVEALELDRTSWRARWELGRLLCERGDAARALEELAAANRNAPEDPAFLATRASMRVDLARAHVRLGELRPALAAAEQALALQPESQAAIAVAVAVATLDPRLAGAPAVPAASAEEELARWLDPLELGASEGGRSLDFDLSFALGRYDLARGRLAAARERLERAAQADPLSAALPLAALSSVAELAGAPEDAWRLAEEARAADPRAPWTPYQLGRLLRRADDLEGARAELERALRLSLDFDEALLALAETLHAAGRHEEAQRYLERAAERLPERPEVHALLGANALARSSAFEAREHFRRALELAPEDPAARGGLAWCAYRRGDAAEALVLLAELEDARRDLPADDPWRAWARRQMERLQDHLGKVLWEDGFERAALRNGWQPDEGDGPLVELRDGAVHLEGAFARSGRVRLFREYPADRFVSLEARLRVSGDGSSRAGVFLARERRRQHEVERQSEVAVARHRDGALEVALARSSSDDGEVLKTGEAVLPADRWVRVRIERAGTEDLPLVDVLVDDVPIVVGAPMPELLRASQAVRAGFFAEGDTGRRAALTVDDVRVVFREGGR